MANQSRALSAAVGALLALAVAACSGGTSRGSNAQSAALSSSRPVPVWPAPTDALKRAFAAGLTPEVKETLSFHVHAHLDVFVDGRRVTVPAGIGINVKDPGVHEFTDTPDGSAAYGGIKRCDAPCISPLHTHDDTGILHTETSTPTPNTLGQFFTEWGVRLTASCVADYCRPERIAFYVNGKSYSQDPRTIQLTFETEIAVVIGIPPAVIPKTADFSQA
jgi:hypothetical protein